MTRILLIILTLTLTLALLAPATAANPQQQKVNSHQRAKASQQKGKASFYAKRFNGAKTASGSRLHNDSLECAHRSYAFGTLLLVRNPANDKEVVVKVVDRGPHVRGRIIDLTYAAAKKIGIVAQGVAPVVVSVYHPNAGIPFPLAPEEIPELDLETTVPPDTIDIIPTWQQKE